MKSRTKEEKFLIAVYEAAKESGDVDAEIDRYAIGQKLGIHTRGIDTICNVLAHANFIKKRGPVNVVVTENGRGLIETVRHD